MPTTMPATSNSLADRSSNGGNTINGVDLDRLNRLVGDCKADPANAQTRWAATTRWTGGALSETRIRGYEIAGKWVPREFAINIDEPHELCGDNSMPNPQDYLLAALNGCMMVGYVAICSLMGIKLDNLEIETEGSIDLRGFLGIEQDVIPGYERLHYKVRISGDGTPEQFEQVHKMVMATSPNRWNISRPIALSSDLLVE